MGMFDRGRALPGLMSASAPLIDRVAHLQAVRGDDVALLAVLILHQRDVGGAVGIVLNGQDGGGHVDLVALEVDDAVLSAVAAAAMADGDAAVAVAAGVFLDGSEQALLRGNLGQLGIIRDASCRGGRR